MVNWNSLPNGDIKALASGKVTLKSLRNKHFAMMGPALSTVYKLERMGVKRARNAARKALSRRGY